MDCLNYPKCTWGLKEITEEGYYFFSYSKDLSKKLFKLIKVNKDSKGRFYDKMGYVDNETHKSGLISTKIDPKYYE